MANQWSDPSAVWQSSTWTDNGGGGYVYALGYDPSKQMMYAGGSYYSIGADTDKPFIVYLDPVTHQWSDPSAVWQSSTWTDNSGGGGGVYALGYDLSKQMMYAGGSYYSIGAGSSQPFIVYLDPVTQQWSDPSAVWHSPTWNDNGGGDTYVYALEYDASKQMMYAGGNYYSIGAESLQPFIVYLDPVTQQWSDPSAVWHSPNWNDNGGNGGYVYALEYDPSKQMMYAGGYYNSIGAGSSEPFIVYLDPATQQWSDPSAVWQSPTWTDNGGGFVYALGYDPVTQMMYAGGEYISIAAGSIRPFIVYLDPATQQWSDPSAVWHSSTWNDDAGGGYVYALGYDPSKQMMYAGGNYNSIGAGSYEPFIVYLDPATQQWSDPSAVWQSPTWNDNGGGGGVSALGYDPVTQMMYAGGHYYSIGADTDEPFIVYEQPTPTPPLTPSVCFKKGTRIHTPNGFVPIEHLKKGDVITTQQGKSISIKKIISFTGDKNKMPLYCLPKDTLGINQPINDLYMSGDHAFKTSGRWHHMKCSHKTQKIATDNNIHYYHIIINNYFDYTINAEGVEVETCFKQKSQEELMLWECNGKHCIPLQCHIASFSEIDNDRIHKIHAPATITFTPQNKSYENTLIYINMNNKKIPLICSEIELPIHKKVSKNNKNYMLC